MDKTSLSILIVNSSWRCVVTKSMDKPIQRCPSCNWETKHWFNSSSTPLQLEFHWNVTRINEQLKPLFDVVCIANEANPNRNYVETRKIWFRVWPIRSSSDWLNFFKILVGVPMELLVLLIPIYTHVHRGRILTSVVLRNIKLYMKKKCRGQGDIMSTKISLPGSFA